MVLGDIDGTIAKLYDYEIFVRIVSEDVSREPTKFICSMTLGSKDVLFHTGEILEKHNPSLHEMKHQSP